MRSLEERFWEKVDKRGPDECWPWLGSKTKGYGSIYANGRNTRATRVALLLCKGETVPPDKRALHTCDNPPCVNPNHLFIGTPKENTLDCLRKGRRIYVRATHCKRGHEMTPENTRKGSGGRGPYCRACAITARLRRPQLPKHEGLARGGRACAALTTPEQRLERARKAAITRRAKTKVQT